MRINEVLASKPTHDVVTVRPDATVRELVALLAEHNIGALVVSADGSSVDGHRLRARRGAPAARGRGGARRRRSPRSCPRDVHTCEADATVNELMQVMTERRFRHVPVVDDGRLTAS